MVIAPPTSYQFGVDIAVPYFLQLSWLIFNVAKILEDVRPPESPDWLFQPQVGVEISEGTGGPEHKGDPKFSYDME